MLPKYNTEKSHLILPEYGRYIQQMVDMAVEVKDDKKRMEMANAIVEIMGRMEPHLREVDDFQHKLWDHLIIMSDYKLNVKSPYGNPTPEDSIITPNRIPYKDSDIRYKQFGRILFKMIEEIDKCETEEEKKGLARVVANHIKKSLIIWDKDVSDEQVVEVMEKISKGRLTLSEDAELANYRKKNRRKTMGRKRKK